MDYFGQGNESSADDRSSYLLEDLAVDTNLGLTVFRGLRLGLTAGFVSIHTGPGKRGGVPATQDAFPIETLPGLEADSDFGRWGAFLALDYRDNPYGPRSGGILATRYRQYADVTRHVYSFHQTDLEFQQYIPYFNRSRVIALRVAAVMTFSENDASVPIYFQPTLGGNDDLRGYARYRFRDNHTIFASVEHRWYVFSGLDMAVFADAGKAVPHKSQLNAAELRYSGGIGFRAKFKNATIMRIDFAQGREGFRAMWTFSDIFKVNY
jgi:outer membrane protein assembly factor BamA